jgi:hypothetical protein
MARCPTIIIAACSLIVGCASAVRFQTRAPVSDACSAAALEKCSELTDAIMDYADGDMRSERRIRVLVRNESPEKRALMAKAIETIASPLDDEKGRYLRAVPTIIVEGDKAAAASPNPKSSIEAPAPGGDGRVRSLQAGVTRPGSEPSAQPCDSGLLGDDATKCKRVRVLSGPFVVTNVHTTGGCADELLVFAGQPEKPHWILGAAANAPLNVGGGFVVDGAEDLHVAARASGAALKSDAKCFVTWAGYRP